MPPYTEEARRARIEGSVLLRIQVYHDGVAHKVQVLRSLGSDLDRNAIDAVQQWRFSPGLKDGKPVIVPATVEVTFLLNDASEPCRARPRQFGGKPNAGPI